MLQVYIIRTSVFGKHSQWINYLCRKFMFLIWRSHRKTDLCIWMWISIKWWNLHLFNLVEQPQCMLLNIYIHSNIWLLLGTTYKHCYHLLNCLSFIYLSSQGHSIQIRYILSLAYLLPLKLGKWNPQFLEFILAIFRLNIIKYSCLYPPKTQWLTGVGKTVLV